MSNPTKAQHQPGLAALAFEDDAYDRVVDEATGTLKDRIPRGAWEVIADEKTQQRWFWFRCPGPCGSITCIALRPVAAPNIQQSWEFNGNEEAPGLEPSINHVGCWHGFLRGGVFAE